MNSFFVLLWRIFVEQLAPFLLQVILPVVAILLTLALVWFVLRDPDHG